MNPNKKSGFKPRPKCKIILGMYYVLMKIILLSSKIFPDLKVRESKNNEFIPVIITWSKFVFINIIIVNSVNNMNTSITFWAIPLHLWIFVKISFISVQWHLIHFYTYLITIAWYKASFKVISCICWEENNVSFRLTVYFYFIFYFIVFTPSLTVFYCFKTLNWNLSKKSIANQVSRFIISFHNKMNE